MKLFKKSKSHFYWYDFTVRGQRYRGSTKESNSTRAAKIAGLKLVLALEGATHWTGRLRRCGISRGAFWSGLQT